MIAQGVVLAVPLSGRIRTRGQFISLPTGKMLWLPRRTISAVVAVLKGCVHVGKGGVAGGGDDQLFITKVLATTVYLTFSMTTASSARCSVRVVRMGKKCNCRVSCGGRVAVFRPFVPTVSKGGPFVRGRSTGGMKGLIVEHVGAKRGCAIAHRSLRGLKVGVGWVGDKG